MRVRFDAERKRAMQGVAGAGLARAAAGAEGCSGGDRVCCGEGWDGEGLAWARVRKGSRRSSEGMRGVLNPVTVVAQRGS